jgi:hypothetical protein
LGAAEINADQNAANVEDDGTDGGSRHTLAILQRRSGWRGRNRASRAENADDWRQNRKENDRGDYVVKVFANVGDPGASDITPKEHAADPKRSTKNVVHEKCGVAHCRSAGDRGTESTHDRNEARQNYGPAAIGFVELVSTLEMATAEE